MYVVITYFYVIIFYSFWSLLIWMCYERNRFTSLCHAEKCVLLQVYTHGFSFLCHVFCYLFKSQQVGGHLHIIWHYNVSPIQYDINIKQILNIAKNQILNLVFTALKCWELMYSLHSIQNMFVISVAVVTLIIAQNNS